MSRLYYEYDTMSEYNNKHINVICPECKSTDILVDDFHQETYCTKCGLVLKDTSIFRVSLVITAEENKNRTLNMFWRETNRQIKLKKIRDIYQVKKNQS
jgi:transcription initiation factor TFIIIB Brf1 subunit/transcription initiation factor TFIIB